MKLTQQQKEVSKKNVKKYILGENNIQTSLIG